MLGFRFIILLGFVASNTFKELWINIYCWHHSRSFSQEFSIAYANIFILPMKLQVLYLHCSIFICVVYELFNLILLFIYRMCLGLLFTKPCFYYLCHLVYYVEHINSKVQSNEPRLCPSNIPFHCRVIKVFSKHIKKNTCPINAKLIELFNPI